MRPIFVLRVRAEPGVDAIRALRAWLKRGLRDFGLRCVGITPREKETNMVDMRQYASTYIKPDDVREGPIQTRIVNVFESERYGRPVLELETGSQFTLNDGNTNTLIKAWGYNSDDWIGQEIELLLGTYKDWRDDPPTEKETVKVRAISPAKTATANDGASVAAKPPLPPSRTAAAGGSATLRSELDDDIPFAPEWR
jgi:hypothetical protein